jgi:hypothetical protein
MDTVRLSVQPMLTVLVRCISAVMFVSDDRAVLNRACRFVGVRADNETLRG